MSKCPYTWFKGFFVGQPNGTTATALRVRVSRNQETVVDVSLPARCAGWLMDLIPDDVITKIKAEGIPLDEIQADLAAKQELSPQKIFVLQETSRVVDVWLE